MIPGHVQATISDLIAMRDRATALITDLRKAYGEAVEGIAETPKEPKAKRTYQKRKPRKEFSFKATTAPATLVSTNISHMVQKGELRKLDDLTIIPLTYTNGASA